MTVMPCRPISCSASFTSSSLKGLMMASIFFMPAFTSQPLKRGRAVLTTGKLSTWHAKVYAATIDRAIKDWCVSTGQPAPGASSADAYVLCGCLKLRRSMGPLALDPDKALARALGPEHDACKVSAPALQGGPLASHEVLTAAEMARADALAPQHGVPA